jgi:hypothetical protein
MELLMPDLTPRELDAMAASFRDALSQFGPLTASTGPLAPLPSEWSSVQAEIDRHHRERVRRWEQHAPMRALAERIKKAADARRASPAPRSGPALAAMWADKPQRPVIF